MTVVRRDRLVIVSADEYVRLKRSDRGELWTTKASRLDE